jgi:hypothetical protein
LYGSLKEVLFQSKVIGTNDTGVKVLDEKLPVHPHRTDLAILRIRHLNYRAARLYELTA